MTVDIAATTLADLRQALSLVPPSIWMLAVLALAVAGSLALYFLLYTLARQAWASRQPFLHSLIWRLRGPVRLALILLALNVTLPLLPVPPALQETLTGTLRVIFIALIGWIVLTALNIAADVYLRRFRIDVADNLLARKQVTQVRVLKGAVGTLVVILTLAAVLMSFEAVRQYGISLFASAGLAGIVAGLAARPVLSNLIAGVQLAITQPIRIDDAVIVEGEWGLIEEITATYVVVRIWDLRRLIVPLSYFIEQPFQNWTRETAALIGVVLVRVDFTVPVDRVRAKAEEIVRASALWDGNVVNLMVTDSDHHTMELRVLASARDAGAAFDLRCEVREKLIAFLQREYPLALPRHRAEWAPGSEAAADTHLDSRRPRTSPQRP